MNGPPCGTCGTPQRWVLERSSWGCDRCRTVQPAHGPSQMSMPGYGPAQKGAFAGGMQRSPSVAPGSYVAPGTLPPENAAYPRAQGGSFGGTPTTMGNPGTNPFGAAYQPGSNPQAQPLPQQPYAQSNPYAAPNPNAYPHQPQAAPAYAPQAQSNPYAAPNAYPQQPQAAPAYAPQAQSNPYAAPNPNAYPQQPQAAPSAYAPQAQSNPYAAPSAYAPQAQSNPYAAPNPAYAPQPQQSYLQATPQAAIAPPGEQRSKKGLLIGGGVVVAVGAGVAIAVAMSGGGGKGGVASRDELVDQTLAAYAARDVDGAVELMGAEDLMAGFADCKETPPGDDPAMAREKIRERFKDQFAELDKAKAKVELVKVLGDSKTTIAKGTEAGPCTFNTELAMVQVNARLKITVGDQPPREREWKLQFLEAGDSWYLTAPLEVELGADCESSVKKSVAASKDLFKKMELTEATVARLEKKLVAHCVDDAWDEAAVKCLADARAEDTNACMQKLSTTQREKVDASIKAIIEQELKAKAPPPNDASNQPPVEPPKPPDAQGDPLPPEEPAAGSAAKQGDEDEDIPVSCDEARTQLAKLDRCKSVPADTRAGMRKAYDIIVQAWKDTRQTPALRENTDKSCTSLVKTVVELRKSLCR